MHLLRSPLLPVGLILVLLGLGNWYTGHNKTIEHEQLLAAVEPIPPPQDFDEFAALNAHTNATLLSFLHRGSDDSAVITAKLDFYRVVQSGGRILTLLGLFCVAAGLIRTWYVAERGRGAPSRS